MRGVREKENVKWIRGSPPEMRRVRAGLHKCQECGKGVVVGSWGTCKICMRLHHYRVGMHCIIYIWPGPK